MEFIYDKKIDEECKSQLDSCILIFDETKKSDVFPVTEDIIKNIKQQWTPKINKLFLKGIKEIFGVDLPEDFKCYINSTPYSMDLDNGVAITASSKTPIRSICHEVNHYLFRKSVYPSKFFPDLDIEDSKEIFTVVNNLYFQEIMEGQDVGWKKFWKARFRFLKTWLKN